MAETFVFVSNAQDGDISGFRLDRSRRRLSPIARTPAAPMVMPLAIDLDTATLHAAIRRAPFSLMSYRIDRATGQLHPLSEMPVANSLVNVRIDPSKRWLLAASYSGNLLTTFGIDDHGQLRAAPVHTFSGGQKPHATLADRDTDLVFVPYLGSDLIHAYRFDSASGRYDEQPYYTLRLPEGSGPRHVVLSANGRFLYVLNELSGTVILYARTSKDAAFVERQCVSSIPSDAGMVPGRARPPSGVAPAADDMPDPDSIYCADIHMTPNGRFLYTSERTRGLLSQFAIDAENGRIERVDTLTTVGSPRSFAIDAAGEFLVAAGQTDTRLALYAIDPTSGKLTLLAHVDSGNDANWVAFATFD